MNKIFIKAHIEKAGEKTYRFLSSTSAIDRQGDSIDQKGWELKNFMKNPVILWAHKYDELPLGKVINLSVTEAGLEAEMVFADEGANPKAKQVKTLVDEGILNAVSVGFIPKERSGNIITRSELLEISIVPVPANQEALALAYKDMDIAVKKDIEEVLVGTNEDEEPIVVEPVSEQPEVVEEVDEVVETPIDEVAGETAEVETKSGRVISKNTRKTIEDAYNALKSAFSELEKLLAIEVATTEDEVDSKSGLVVISRSVIEDLKFQLRGENKQNDKILSILKEINN